MSITKKITPELTAAVATTETTNTKGHKDTTERIKLNDGSSVPKKEYDSLLHHLELRMPTLIYGHEYTLIDICIPRFLVKFPLDNTVAGKCLAHMVKENLLPLTPAGKTDQNWRLYRRI